MNDPKYVGFIFDYMMKYGIAPNMYMIVCGRVTPAKRDNVRRRYINNVSKYKLVLNWLIDNHPSYSDMKRKPIIHSQELFVDLTTM